MTTESTSADDATRRDGSALSEGLGAWVRTADALPPVGVELFATGWAYEDPSQGRYYSVVVYQGDNIWANPEDLERANSDAYRPTHWMLPPPVSA